MPMYDEIACARPYDVQLLIRFGFRITLSQERHLAVSPTSAFLALSKHFRLTFAIGIMEFS